MRESERICMHCGEPVDHKWKGYPTICRKHKAHRDKLKREGKLDELRKFVHGAPFRRRAPRDRYDNHEPTKKAIAQYVAGRLGEGPYVRLEDLASKLDCFAGRLFPLIRRYCAEHNHPYPLPTGIYHREGTWRTRKAAKNYRGSGEGHKKYSDRLLRMVITAVLEGDLLTHEAAAELGVTPRTMARWIEDSGLVDQVGDKRANVPGKKKEKENA